MTKWGSDKRPADGRRKQEREEQMATGINTVWSKWVKHVDPPGQTTEWMWPQTHTEPVLAGESLTAYIIYTASL